ncbi:MAG: radical SAM protein [Eubacterium sp.]|nr:radical SAM protein [Eubacterium sp.]
MREIKKICLAISYYCELNCQHCYVPQQLRDKYDEIMAYELSIEQIKEFLEYLVINYRLQKVDITGGEALLTKVWSRTKEVVEFALSKGLEVQINTTGSGNITPYMIKETFGENLTNLLLHVSLDGIDEQYVDSFRGRKGAFQASTQFMKDALALRIKVRTRLTMSRENIEQIVPCYDFVSGLGVQSFMCKPVNIVGNSLKNSLNTLSTDELRKVQLKLLERSMGNSTALHLPAPLAICKKEIPNDANVEIFHCLCGKHMIYVAYNGDIFPCTYMAGMNNCQEYIIGNIRDSKFDFSTVWEKSETYAEFRKDEKSVCTAHRLSVETAYV